MVKIFFFRDQPQNCTDFKVVCIFFVDRFKNKLQRSWYLAFWMSTKNGGARQRPE